MRRRKAARSSVHSPIAEKVQIETHTTSADGETTVQQNHISTPFPDSADHIWRIPVLWSWVWTSIQSLGALLLLYLEQVWYSYTGQDGVMVSLGRWMGGGSDANGDERVELVQRGRESRVQTPRRRRGSIPPGSEVFFPGMVNLSGVLCYMNSVLQALASLHSLTNHLTNLETLAVDLDFPTPVTDSLLLVLNSLNTPSTRPPTPLRPHGLITALQPLPPIRRLLGTREQQDAHELFLALSEAVSDEALKVAREVLRLRGIAEVLTLQGYCAEKGGVKIPGGGDELGKEKTRKVRGLAQPWEGLLARRRVCRVCGWCEAVRMDTLGGMELALPQQGNITLDACIAEYLAPENLSGVTCEMCSLRQTISFYETEIARLSSPPSKSPAPQPHPSRPSAGSFGVLEHLSTSTSTSASSSTGPIGDKRKKKLKEAIKVKARLDQMHESQTILAFGEPSIPPSPSSASTTSLPVKWQKANTDSTREASIARTPQSLRLHCIRSSYTPYGIQVKSSARVQFPMILDLTRFVANGVWDDRADVMGMLSKKGAGGTDQRKALYRLEAAILHYGYTTSSGHFIAIRRKPVPPVHPEPDDGAYKPGQANKACPDGCTCQECLFFGQVREQSVPGRGWLRVSDADVDEVGEEALREAAGAVFMLFYERIGEYAPPAPKVVNGEVPRSSDID